MRIRRFEQERLRGPLCAGSQRIRIAHESLGDLLFCQLGAHVVHINADGSAAGYGVKSEAAGMGDVEAEGLATKLPG